MINLAPGDAVKIAGRRGNFRFLQYLGENQAAVVGPIGGDGENEKVVTRDKLRPAKGVSRKSVAPNKLAVEISSAAHANKKGG